MRLILTVSEYLKNDRRGNLRHSTIFTSRLWAVVVQYDHNNWFSIIYNEKISNAIIYYVTPFPCVVVISYPWPTKTMFFTHRRLWWCVLRPHMTRRNCSVWSTHKKYKRSKSICHLPHKEREKNDCYYLLPSFDGNSIKNVFTLVGSRSPWPFACHVNTIKMPFSSIVEYYSSCLICFEIRWSQFVSIFE